MFFVGAGLAKRNGNDLFMYNISALRIPDLYTNRYMIYIYIYVYVYMYIYIYIYMASTCICAFPYVTHIFLFLDLLI